MRWKLKKCSLTEEQVKYVTENKHLSSYELGRRLGLQQAKVYDNMILLNLITPKPEKPVFYDPPETNGFFDVNKFAKLMPYYE
jgi:hypothetical protein